LESLFAHIVVLFSFFYNLFSRVVPFFFVLILVSLSANNRVVLWSVFLVSFFLFFFFSTPPFPPNSPLFLPVRQ